MASTGESTGETEPTSDPGDTLLFENDRVRVWSMTLPPHGTYEFHQHFHDHLIIWPEAGRAVAQQLGDEGWPLSQEVESGFVAFKTVGARGPLVPHRIRNVEDRTVTHYIVELIEYLSPSSGPEPAQTNDRGVMFDTRTGERV
jgi:beta-alanine degradation protein BauB